MLNNINISQRCIVHGKRRPCPRCSVQLQELEAELHQFPAPEPPSTEESLERLAAAVEELVVVVSRLVSG